MTRIPDQPSLTAAAARDLYFEVNGFGPKGGYDDAWVDFSFGPVPFPFPNTAGRVRAVRFHDLHHVLTGYDTDTRGEFEISAWEVGAGCGRFFTALAINLGGVVAGLVSAPGRVLRAFARGRRTRSLYDGRAYEELLPRTVGELRTACGLDGPAVRPGASDVALLALAALAGVLVWVPLLPLILSLLPLGLVTRALRNRSLAAQASKS